GPFVPVEPQPAQRIHDGSHALEAAAFLVRVLDSQEELTPLLSGPQPVEQGRSGSANVKVSAGGRRKAHSHGHGAPEYHLRFAASPASGPLRPPRAVFKAGII